MQDGQDNSSLWNAEPRWTPVCRRLKLTVRGNNVLSKSEARSYLIGQAGLRQTATDRDASAAARKILRQLRCIQLDPLDVIGTNAELVVMARTDGFGGLARGSVYNALLPGHAFEHYAKERCLLPAAAFPAYRDQAEQTPTWRSGDRLRRLDKSLLVDVLAEVQERGPITAAELSDRGNVTPLDWSGWKSTSKATTMALEVLALRCKIVVCGRRSGQKLYDVPSRALADVHDLPGPADRRAWALLERVEAAGLLATAGGPWWSMLRDARRSDTVERLVADGMLEHVSIEGSRRSYLAPAGFRDRTFAADDGRLRVLGPLDSLIWDRNLIHHIFDFEYIWEVYKPAAKRRWGWYVCPLLHNGAFIGRVEPRRDDSGKVHIDNLWVEEGHSVDRDELHAALRRLERQQ